MKLPSIFDSIADKYHHLAEPDGPPADPVEAAKCAAAVAAVDLIRPGCLLGVGSGSTVALFVAALGHAGVRPSRAVSTSDATDALLDSIGIVVVDLESVGRPIDIYVDGADEIDNTGRAIKGGGGAHTREKAVAKASDSWVCIVDESKVVPYLGYHAAVPVEIERDYLDQVMEALRGWGASPLVREGWSAHPAHALADVARLDLSDPDAAEKRIEALTGVVACGIFAERRADVVFIGTPDGSVRTLRVGT